MADLSGLRPLTSNRKIAAASVVALLCLVVPADAQRIENQVAVFATLDKVTARISKLEVPLGQSVKFGSLKVTPRVCYSRPPTEPPKTTSFVEVEETQLDGQVKKLFSGWMFAESPGLNAVEHPVFDVWLTDCGQPARAAAAVAKGGGAAAGQTPEEQPIPTRRRPPR
ncbi:MAG: DUF2155 domain-containing protein [Hyphomicrobiaceae bacterium]